MEMNLEKPKWLAGTDIRLCLVTRNPSFGFNQRPEKTLLQKRTQHTTRPKQPLEFH